jgi:hypothetical protein
MINAVTSHADLHTHSDRSDGTLPPAALVAHAARHGVALLALTDHDSVDGCEEAAQASASHGLRFVSGCELSLGWRGQPIHVVGLALDAASAVLRAHFDGIARRRLDRLHEIGERLERRGRLPGRELAARIAARVALPTRTHLARELVALGAARDVQEAIDAWLARGRPGHVPVDWPALPDGVATLRACGAWPVLAHPHRYRLSTGALRALATEFADAGGVAIEVSIGGMSRSDLDRLATLARRRGLAASCGSDFHDPATPWNPPGRFAKLPDDLEPISARL